MASLTLQLSLVPIDTHLHAIAMRHPSFPSRLKSKRMSKAIYDDVQSFLAECWGPCAGWAQAVMFAAAVQAGPVTKNSPRATPSFEVKTEKEANIKRTSEDTTSRDGNLKRTRRATRDACSKR